jgi:hypothetical protein
MINIYDKHRAAFDAVSAYVIVRDGARIGTIAFKYPRDGAGRLYAYVHFHGAEMVRGFAAGGGYDKHSAACRAAACRIEFKGGEKPDYLSHFVSALAKDDGCGWDHHLRSHGFGVWQAV